MSQLISICRTEFILDEGGDVSWKVAEEAEPLPFFNCETYEVHDLSFTVKQLITRSLGVQWLSGRVLDSIPKGCWFEPHHCLMSLCSVLEQDTLNLA